MAIRTIATLAHGRDNNFNLLRMLAAGAVLVSHAYPLALGGGGREPLEGLAPANLGRLAVTVFFAISGFFIAKSFDRRTSLIAFAVDRVLRIYPGLLVMLILTVVLLGPALGSLSFADYWHARGTWTYIPHNASLFRMQWTLPGLFVRNPGSAVNGSLWTLGYEVSCYAMVVLAGFVSLLVPRRFWLFLLGYAIFYIGALADNDLASVAREVSLPFVIGMAFYVYRDRVPLHGAILLAFIAVAASASWTSLYREAFVGMLAYGSFWFGALPWGWLKNYNRLGDYSYGTYIYAFPVEQATVAFAPGITPHRVILVALPFTLLLASLSWFLVEKPALSRRHAIGRSLRL